jgi:hypothetical protein
MKNTWGNLKKPTPKPLILSNTLLICFRERKNVFGVERNERNWERIGGGRRGEEEGGRARLGASPRIGNGKEKWASDPL